MFQQAADPGAPGEEVEGEEALVATEDLLPKVAKPANRDSPEW